MYRHAQSRTVPVLPLLSLQIVYTHLPVLYNSTHPVYTLPSLLSWVTPPLVYKNPLLSRITPPLSKHPPTRSRITHPLFTSSLLLARMNHTHPRLSLPGGSNTTTRSSLLYQLRTTTNSPRPASLTRLQTTPGLRPYLFKIVQYFTNRTHLVS